MSDRSVSIDLIAKVSGFVASMKTAQASVRSFTTDIEKSAKKQQALRELGNAAGAMGLVAAGGFFLAVKAAANFDSAMSKVQAATHESAANMDLLRQAAIDAGQKTVFSATESADAITALSKAGVTSKDILGGGLAGALSLASAGELDVASAAEIAATAMNQFGLQGKDVPHIADLLAAAAGKAMGSVTDMATSLKYVGPVAAQMGISIEETTGTIAELAQAGVQGDQAGTSLRGMLTALTSPSKIAKTEMDKLGISMYDATGNFVGLNGVAGQLHDKMSVLSNAERDQALGRIFGNQQITAARILYAGGAKDVDKWTAAVNDQGYAAETAAIKMDNLHGDLEQLRGSLETALIGTGEGATGPLRELVQLLTNVTNAYIGLPSPIKSGILAFTGFIAVAGLTVFALSRIVVGVATTRASMKELGISAGQGMTKGMLAARVGAAALGVGLIALAHSGKIASEGLSEAVGVMGQAAMGFAVGGPWGAAIGGAIGALTALNKGERNTAVGGDALTSTLDKQTFALTDNSRALIAKSIADAGAIKLAVGLGVSTATVTDAAMGSTTAYAALKTQLIGTGMAGNLLLGIVDKQIAASKQSAATARDEATAQMAANVAAHAGLADKARATDTTRAMGNALVITAGAAGKNTGATKANTDALDKQAAAVQKNIDKQLALHDALLAGVGGQIAFRASVRDAMKGVDKFTGSIFDQTKAGDAQLTKLAAVASAWNDLTPKMQKATGASQDARHQFLMVADAMDVPRARALRLANQWLDTAGTLEHTKPKVDVDTSGAMAKLEAYRLKLIGLQSIDIVNNVLTVFGTSGTPTPRPGHHASGGLLSGPGGPREDNIPIWASAGEFIVNAAATSHNLGLLHSINAQGFAAGGTVSRDQQRSDIDALTQAIRALTGGVKHFNIKPGDDASAARSAVHDLISQLRDVVGKDSHLLAHITKLGDRIVDLSKAQDRATTKYDNATARLDRLQQASAAYASTVKSAFTHDPLTGSLASSTLQLRADRNDARSAGRDLTRLRHRGLSGGLLKNLQASGNTQLIDELAGASNRDLHAYEALYASTNKATSRIGSQSANALWGKQIDQQTQVVHRLHKSIDSLNHRIDHLEHAIERGANKGTRLGIQDRDHRAAVLRNARR